jgi:hypothetical protein
MKTLFSLAVGLVVAGCTDADMAHFSQLGDESEVQCFSGGQVIYSGTSTGKIQSDQSEDGLYFMEKESGKFVRLYADCVVKAL